MREAVSLQEMKSNLTAPETGEFINKEDERNKIRPYDFRRPIKLSKEYINTLYMIFESFSKVAGNILSAQIRTNLSLSVNTVEQLSYDEFISSIPRSTLIGVFHSKPLNGTQVLAINHQLCLQIIELMCGGSESKFLRSINKKESFTDIELGILEEIVTSILKSFESTWTEIIEIETEIDSLETNTQLIQKMSPNEPVILISLNAEVNNHKSFIYICIPYVSFENIIDKLSFRNWFDFNKEADERDKEILTERIMSSNVNLEVILGKSTVTIDEFLKLDMGDIIPLDIKITDPLKMYIEDKLHYLVKPGQLDGKMAVQVLKYVEEDVEK